MVPTRLVLLFANWYSGATLATVFLNAHPHIVSNGEAFPFTSDDLSDYICSCGQRLHNCDFYSDVAAHMKLNNKDWNQQLFTQLPEFSKNSYVNRLMTSPKLDNNLRNFVIKRIPDFRNKISAFLDAHYLFATKATVITGATVYLDGTKSIARALLLSNDRRYSINAIHLIRDGRGFCSSYMRNMQLPYNERGIEISSRAWIDYIDSVNAFKKARPDIPLITVRHEDICKKTDKTLSRLFAFMGVDPHDVSRPTMNGRHILGNKIRNTFFGDIRDDRGWENELSNSVKEQITARIEDQLRNFEYIL